jgi:hypothetical protein
MMTRASKKFAFLALTDKDICIEEPSRDLIKKECQVGGGCL